MFSEGVRSQFAEHGLVGLGRWDLVEDVVNGGSKYPPAEVVEMVLPHLVTANNYIPVFKYLRELEVLTRKGKIKKSATVPARVSSMAGKVLNGLFDECGQ